MITQDKLKERLSYDPETGDFTWVSPPYRSSHLIGKKAGFPSGNGYWKIGVDGKLCLAHRLAWLYVYGVWPEKSIDHANGNRSDNRIVNLRLSTQSQNSGNMLPRPNKLKGAYKNSLANTWFSTITCNGKATYLGCFPTAEEANAAYAAAAHKLFGEFARS